MIWLISGAWAGAYEVLRLRDGADCAALGSGEAVRDELIVLAEGDVQPAYVPIRAAECLVARWSADPVVVERARAWVAAERWAGLGLIVGRRIDVFAVGDAVGIARAAVAADSRAVSRIARSTRREVVDVVEGGR